MADFAARSRQPELMDDPDLDKEELEHALKHLTIINRLLNGYGPSLMGVRRLLPKETTAFSLLDVGCGSGDTLRRIAEWAKRAGVTSRLVGVELSADAANKARRECAAYPEIEIRQQDFFAIDQNETFDVVHSALVMHHFSKDEDVIAAFKRMIELSRRGVLVNDLHRHWAAYYSIRILTQGFSRSRVLQHDAPLSVARAFTRTELIQLAGMAGLKWPELSWHWAFRWLMILRKGNEDASW